MTTKQSRMESDLHVAGRLTFVQIGGPNGSLSLSLLAAPSDPANGLPPAKYVQRHRKSYSQESATSAASEARVVHVAAGDGTIVDVSAGCVVANVGAATVDVDLLVNGVSVLVSPIQIDSGDAAYAVLTGALSDASVSAGDVIEIQITATAGGGTLGKGVFAILTFDEEPA